MSDPIHHRDLTGRAQRHPEKAHRADNPSPKKPDWIRVRAPNSPGFFQTRNVIREHGLSTVCQEAGCPNVGECWAQGHATMMIMGEICTRGCTFCNVATGRPNALDAFEPGRVAQAVEKLGLKHVVITSVDRDDLEDGGAGHIAQTIRAVRRKCPDTTIEVLTPDFLRKAGAAEVVVAARPDVYNHNLETVPRLYRQARPGGDYLHSLELLQEFKRAVPAVPTKSGLMVGLGETDEEILQVMRDLRAHGVDMLTIGQYLQPSPHHLAVERYVHPDVFAMFEREAQAMGFRHAAIGALVRSSPYCCSVRRSTGSGICLSGRPVWRAITCTWQARSR